jgi:trypsin
MRLVNVFFLFFSFFISNLFSQSDIVGGEDANIQDYPYQAALLSTGGWGGGYAYCGASIINEYWILTAAHCVQGESANNTGVRVGNSSSYAQGGVTYDAAEIISHPNYNSNTMNNDIALIRLADPITYNNNTQPVVLMCDQQVELGVQDPGEMSWITGWGEDEGTANNPNQLQVVGVPITNTSSYGSNQIDADMIMAGYSSGGYDSCQGDSGGPMVVLAADGETYLQCGVVSWGYGCAEAGYPGVYSRVSYFIDWICDNTGGAVCPNQSVFCDEDAVYGCTDSSAINYNSEATANDGSCQYPCDNNIDLEIHLDCYGEEISWEIINENGVIIAQVSSGTYPGGSTSETMEVGGSLQQEEICLSAGCYTFTITDSYGDGLSGSEFSCEVNGAPFSITDENGEVLFEETNPAFGDCVTGGENGPCSESYNFCITAGEPIYGCTDLQADNYDPNANTNDGSCQYFGCTDSNYLEYDLNANVDDGSCTTLIVEGCMDSTAENYNPDANQEDGSCTYLEGCTDPNAENYNPDAIINDGSCEYSYSWTPCNNQNWFEDFESYDDSDIDSQSTEWIGWDGANSGVSVTDDFAFISNQSILVEQDDDLIHMFSPAINSGSGEVIFHMYIRSANNAGAYYNMLHEYNGTDSNWAFQVFFASQNSGEQSYIDADQEIYFDAIYDTWVEVRHEININTDLINLYYNNELLHSWSWSNGSAGNSNILDALNLFGFCTGSNCTSEAWYDNIEVCGFENDNTSINESQSLNLDIFPNPNNGNFELISNIDLTDYNISILDLTGKLIFSKQINYNTNSKYRIKLNQAAGTYIMKIYSDEFSTQKLIIIE